MRREKGKWPWIKRIMDGALPAFGGELGRAIWKGGAGLVAGGATGAMVEWLRDLAGW